MMHHSTTTTQDARAGAVDPADAVLTPATRDRALALLAGALSTGVDLKVREDIYAAPRVAPERLRDLIVDDLPEVSSDPGQVIDDIRRGMLPYCKNEASPRFAGFADTGADIAALAGAVLALFAQQNLINQSFDSPSATFVDIAVLRWLRDFVGYDNPALDTVADVWDVGGVLTQGGTGSNAVAMMLAREHAAPGTMREGVRDPGRFKLVVPAGIGHYSVKGALGWLGCGDALLEVPVSDYRYDLAALRRALRAYDGRVMGVVAYAGDSRTQTIDDLVAVHDVVRGEDPGIWLHADACWGLLAAFTSRLRHKIRGIERYDSVTVDAHKVMEVPYTLSALLVRDPQALRSITTYSDLIMRERFAFGQVTPFTGSRAWESLKLWAMMRARGRAGLAAMADHRIATVAEFTRLVDAQPRLVRLHDPDLTALVFAYLPAGHDPAAPDVERINLVNRRVHADLMRGGRWHLHQFSVPDAGRIAAGAEVWPLRFLGGNSRTTPGHLAALVDEVVRLGDVHDAR
ncbi:pyridoxal-dependent decarboxylase [Embleya sp. NPDC005575]|uniref:pyridoxal phosphate-dependent decarboxylase family protein n=1 Tax=Embleya sp. NPDC005575 TaxID=3156892 RepID=UPI00339DC48F